MSTGDTSMGNPILAPVSVISPRWVIIQVGKMKVNRDKFYWLQQDTAGYLRLKDLLISSQLVWKGTKRVGCTMVEKFPYKGKKGRYKKGKWVFLRLPADYWRLSLKRRMVVACHYSPPGNIFGKFNQNVLAPKGGFYLEWMQDLFPSGPVKMADFFAFLSFYHSAFLSFCLSMFLSFCDCECM